MSDHQGLPPWAPIPTPTPKGQTPKGPTPEGQRPPTQVDDRSTSGRPRTVGVGVLAVCTLLAGLIGGGVAAGAVVLTEEPQAAGYPEEAPQGTQDSDSGVPSTEAEEAALPDGDNAVTAAAAEASPSVVTLAVADGSAAGSGSGMVLDAEGHVLTNTHVTTLGGQSADPDITVRLDDGSVTSAELVGTDPLSDLAVIRLQDTEGLVPADLGDSADLNVGDQVIAVGAPLGLDGTVTSGIVSALDRTISVASAEAPEEDQDRGTPPGEEDRFEFFLPESQPSAQNYMHLNVIQTDAAINQGNSGGPLVNDRGEIIGVNVAIASTGGSESAAGSIGVGFSIPIDYAERIAADLIANGEASHGFLGVQVIDAAAQQAATGIASGAAIDDVVADSPAAEAGLEAGDVITEVDGRTVADSSALTAIIREYPQGEQVTVTFLRDGEQQQTEVALNDT